MARTAAKVRAIGPQSAAVILPAGRPAHASERPRVVDEFGRLSAQLESLKPLVARHEQLRQRIASWFETSDPNEGYSEDGAQYSVQVGPKASKRTVSDLDLIFHRLGAHKFLQITNVSMEKLDNFMLPADQADCVAIERTGPRTIRAIAKFSEPTQ